MKLMPLLATSALTISTTACVGTSNERIREAAFQACKDRVTEQKRVTCRKTERARLQAGEREDLAEIAKAESEAERRQAELEALGVPEDSREQTFDPILKPSR